MIFPYYSHSIPIIFLGNFQNIPIIVTSQAYVSTWEPPLAPRFPQCDATHPADASAPGTGETNEPVHHSEYTHNWLVVKPPLWKIWTSIGMMKFPIYGNIKNVPNHQPDNNPSNNDSTFYYYHHSYHCHKYHYYISLSWINIKPMYSIHRHICMRVNQHTWKAKVKSTSQVPCPKWRPSFLSRFCEQDSTQQIWAKTLLKIPKKKISWITRNNLWADEYL